MSVWAGIDIGTSGVKVALFDDAERLLADASRPLEVSRPQVGWSEQHPDLWWDAVAACFDDLAAAHPGPLARLKGIGLSGQMMGSVLLDTADRPLRPAILWNDQRAIAECAELLERLPDIGSRTGGAPDPGFSAAKLLWLARHEPQVLDAARLLLLPKDYVRLLLTGERASEPSDAGLTMLLDVAGGRWEPALCAAAGWSLDRLPRLSLSWAETGRLRAALAARWGTPAGVAVAAGAGDNMACTIGVGAARPGDVVVTIGTSGVVCAVDRAFHPAPEQAVLTSAHAAPGLFLSLGVVMSATASLDWLARLTGTTAAALAGEAEACFAAGNWPAAPVMRPSLSGIRTPQNRPDTGGVIDGLTQVTDRAALGYALLEGVAFQIAECAEAQKAAGVRFEELRLVGGGARSALWGRLIATLLEAPLAVPEGAALAANRGAARLGRAAAGEGTGVLARQPPIERLVEPLTAEKEALAARCRAYRALPLNGRPAACDGEHAAL